MLRLRTWDWSLVAIVLILVVVSVATIYTITYVSVGNKLALSQSIYILIGFILFILFSMLDYRHFRGWAFLLLGIGILTLVPLVPFFSHKLPFVICEFNACRWIDLGFFRFQSSELFKLITVIALSTVLVSRVGKMQWWHLLLLLGALAVPLFLIMEEPDLGTAIVVAATGGALLLMGRFPVWIWIVLLLASIIAMPVAYQSLKPYQKKRIEVFLHPDKDPNRTGYNVRQAQIAVGSGGVLGRGFGQGSQSQLNFLPVAHTDFIFAGYAEATGYVGSIFLILVFAFLVWRAFYIAQIAKDSYGQLLAVGIGVMIAVQVFINIGMNIRLMPVTGVPLPLVSYGGTSLFVTMMALGVLQSIAIRHKKISFN